ncbi:hypothetical protein GEMRC1_012356 [Eukaryota sp. GEM-RC1]
MSSEYQSCLLPNSSSDNSAPENPPSTNPPSLNLHSHLSISNVTACFELNPNETLDLGGLADQLWNVTFSSQFPALDIKLSRPNVLAKISDSGKVNIVGAIDEDECRLAMDRVCRLLRKLNIPFDEATNFRVYQAMGSAKLGTTIDIEALQANNRHCCQWEYHRFRRVRYKIEELKVTVQIYNSGSLVFLGPNAESISEAASIISPIIERHIPR